MADSTAPNPKTPLPPTATATSIPTFPGEEPVIEVAQEDELDDDALAEELSKFTASLSSSVLDYPIEHGRRFHAFRKGSYIFPNDERELGRLDLFHHIMVRSLGCKLYLAPIEQDKVQRILDIGTGTGAWAVEMGDLFPGAEVIGSDLSAIQPSWIPPNVKFEIDDVESEWAYGFKFDFILCRYMAGSIGDWPKLAQTIYDNLTPGSWAEFQDLDLTYASDDGSVREESHTVQWNKVFLEGLHKINRDPCPGPKLLQYATDAGFTNLCEKVIKIPIGGWAKDPELKQLGMMNLVQLLEGLEAFSLKVFLMQGYTEEEVTLLLAKVRREVKSRNFHAYIKFYIVSGQKPAE